MKRFIIAMLLVVCFAINSYAADAICPDCPTYTQKAYLSYLTKVDNWFTGIAICNTSDSLIKCRRSDCNAVLERFELAPGEVKVFNYTDEAIMNKIYATGSFEVVVIYGNPDFGLGCYNVKSEAIE